MNRYEPCYLYQPANTCPFIKQDCYNCYRNHVKYPLWKKILIGCIGVFIGMLVMIL